MSRLQITVCKRDGGVKINIAKGAKIYTSTFAV